MIEFEKIYGLGDLDKFTKEILSFIGDGGIILLRGNLASGKTAFAKAFAKAIGLLEDVSSPSFSVLNEYDNRFFHYDVYQGGLSGFLQNGLFEKLEESGYHLIEWAGEDFERALSSLGIGYSTIDIEVQKEKRIYKVKINAHSEGS
ncbi:MAG: tRNA (adenosine(37)-N6)-threonylcarbamoyltransferase complex ATPase subunit type 1 TsaE [Sulfurospirillaceae bacterium]|nr:tRNA (adenosine(37)-N6)-threonylcarbamoyltransferase complex ATPase subunit type 1 TsaE [Sulfurospirillaceae bacterium]